ncbi:lytic murein transglycosylase [Pelagibacterium luteolum]|uniref:Membrane-bound lytic murein transglycosylase B n=1 Tax=Pelagibacterium luteolum TaxID=440168 RepID=A0A1G7TR89_9HYPH|nr:lytic murein transglycosylase [Pelagibacterium luteolum]SDG37702.1 membrane-bound lytic murein transglycosylase B [Pelagibacterium luteolum]
MRKNALSSSTPGLTRRHAIALALGAGASLMLPRPAFSNVQNFVASLWPEAQARGVSRAIFDAAMAGFSPSSRIMELTRTQPEVVNTTGQYIGNAVSSARITTGRNMRAEWAQTLGAVQQRWGVQPEIVLAIWGMETNYGSYMGGNNVIHALATLTHGQYRYDFFKRELLTAMQILQAGHVAPAQMVGSWAGAMGHTQFMPTSFMSYAVDYNGNGRRDIWNSIPDALASAANYLKEHGWRPGETWGYEVDLPSNFDYGRAWDTGKQSIGNWAAMGVRRTGGRQFPRADDSASLFMPAGGGGPSFLMLRNFDVIKRYNNSNNYALGVGHLADRILGTGGFVRPFPANETGLNRNDRMEIQRLLNAKGFNVGTPDGVVGPNTRRGIIAYQRAAGLLPDGYPSSGLLAHLR